MIKKRNQNTTIEQPKPKEQSDQYIETQEINDIDLTEEALAASNFNNRKNQKIVQKREVWLKPITKKRFIVKLIPFMILTFLAFGFGLFLIIFASVRTQEQLSTSKLNFYLFAPILWFVASPFCFYLFDRAYCQYNLKHNEAMKNKIGKLFVRTKSQNGCFNLKEIYLSNPNQLCWLNSQQVIIENYKRWAPDLYEEDIKYYKEMKI